MGYTNTIYITKNYCNNISVFLYNCVDIVCVFQWYCNGMYISCRSRSIFRNVEDILGYIICVYILIYGIYFVVYLGPAFLALLKLTENEWFNTEYIPFMIGIQVFLGYGLLVIFQIIQAWVYERFNDWQVTYYFFAGLCFISFIIFVIILIYDYYKANMMYDNIEDEDPQLVLTRIKNGEYSSTKRSISYSMSKKRSSLFRDDTNTELNQKLSTKYKYAVKNIQNWLLITWGFCGLMIVNGVYGLWMINYLMVKFGFSRSISASINGTYYIARAVIAPIVGKLSIRFQKRKIFLIGGALLWTSTLYIIYGPNTMSIPTIISMNIISGIGGMLSQYFQMHLFES